MTFHVAAIPLPPDEMIHGYFLGPRYPLRSHTALFPLPAHLQLEEMTCHGPYNGPALVVHFAGDTMAAASHTVDPLFFTLSPTATAAA